MKRLLILVVASVAGCGNNFRTCSQDSECQSDGVCSDGVCYQRAGGGGGDGGVGGGDGGAGGGQGGGTSTPCSAGCAEWQTCRPTSLATGICENARVRALSPQANTEFGAGNTVTFVFEVTQWDAGMWPGDVPLAVAAGMVAPTPSRLTRKGVTFEADVALANRAGAQTVVAGWLAVDAGLTVVAKKCDVNCKPWEECVPDPSGGQCADMQLTLSFTAPTTNQEYGPINSGEVPLALAVTRADGGPFASPVPFALSKGGATRLTGALDKSGGVWRATADAGADDGARGLYAGWDGGPYTTGTFKVTATPPTIALVPETAPARAPNQTDGDGNPRWKKSEVAPVKVTSNRDLLAAPVPGDFSNASVATSTRCTSCAAPRCYCFEVDLAPEAFTQAAPGTLYGTVPVSLNKPLVDALGNSGSAAPASFDVTRFKWWQDVSSGTARTPTAIALTTSGTVVVGVSAALSPAVAPSALTALNPDGGIAWQKSYSSEAITAGPLIGITGAFIAVNNGTQGQLRRLSLADGTTFTPDRCLAASLTYQGDMALASPGASEFPVVVRSDGRLMGSTNQADCTSTPLAGGLGANTPTVMVTDGSAYVAAHTTKATLWKLGSLDATPQAQGTKTVGTLISPTNLFSIGIGVVGGGGFAGGAFVFGDSGGVLDGGATTNDAPGTDPASAAIVGPGSSASEAKVHYGDNGGHLRSVAVTTPGQPAFGTRGTVGLQPNVDFTVAAPLLGQGGHLYAAGLTSTGDSLLEVVSASDLSTEEWHWATTETIKAQLNLDINRDAAHPCASGQPGVLYVVTSRGTQTLVHAILVDSQGVEATAPWPRYQHNPANTGNSGTSLTPWVCP